MAGVSSLWYPPKSPQETGTTRAGPLGTARLHQANAERLRKLWMTLGGGFSPTAGFLTRGEQVASAGDPAPRPAPPAERPSAGSPHGPRSCGRVDACAGSWDARTLADDLPAGLAADPVYDSVDELAWAIRAQLAALAVSPAFPLRSRPNPTNEPRLSGFHDRRVPGVSPSCSTLARRTALSALACPSHSGCDRDRSRARARSHRPPSESNRPSRNPRGPGLSLS